MQQVLIGWIVLCGLALSAIDIREHRLPNRLVAILGVGCMATLAISHASNAPLRVNGPATITALGVSLIAGVTSLVAPRMLGMGDAKLVLALAPALATTSPTFILCGLWLSSILALVAVLGRAVVARVPIRAVIAFGPFIVAGAIASLVLPSAAWLAG